MQKAFRSLRWLAFFLFLSGCASANVQQTPERTLAPDLATGTALVARKYTEIAKMTLYPATPPPAETAGPAATLLWTPMPGEITASDSGKSFDIWITSRISIILNAADYPPANLVEDCLPKDTFVIGRVSNIPMVPAGAYVFRYEGVGLGQCTIRNGSFAVTIRVVNHP